MTDVIIVNYKKLFSAIVSFVFRLIFSDKYVCWNENKKLRVCLNMLINENNVEDYVDF